MTDAQRVEAQSERLRYATVAWLRLLKQTEGGPSVERVASDTMIALAAVLAHEAGPGALAKAINAIREVHDLR